MKNKTISLALLIISVPLAASATTNVINEIINNYSKIKSVSCIVSRVITFNEKDTRLLSRVYYERPNKLHVQQTSPLNRRIICDGTNFFYYIDGDPKGYSSPVDKLSEQQIIELVKVPGTSEDILYRLKNIEPKELSGNEEYPTQLAFTTTNNLNIIVYITDEKRIEKIDFFESNEFAKLTSSSHYSNFIEATPGVFVPTTHKMVLNINKQQRTETAKFSHYTANAPISQSLFYAKPFFKGVTFVDSFKEIYE
ncbi:MAG: hypothetical protein PF692_10770 [Kiritimatiellae bacterium]|nr:hypothetical protein [Kiritimatiellia bacterium]